MIYYPMAIFQDANQSNFSGIIPDLTGCYPSADSIDELMTEAQSLAEFHIEGMIAEGYEFNDQPQSITQLRQNPDYAEALMWAVFAVDESTFNRQVRFNVSWNEHLLKRVDEYVAIHHDTRSGFLAKAAQAVLNQTSV